MLLPQFFDFYPKTLSKVPVDLSIVLPVRLDDRVFETVERIQSFLVSKAVNFEIVVAGCLARPEQLLAPVKFIHSTGRKGDNIVAGVAASSGTYILLLDADLPIKVSDLWLLFIQAPNFDAVLGIRNFPKNCNVPLLRVLRTRVFRAIVGVMFPQLRHLDTQFGVKLLRASIAYHLLSEEMYCRGLGVDLELLLKLTTNRNRIHSLRLEYQHASDSVVHSCEAAMELIQTLLYFWCNNHSLVPCRQ